MKLKVSSFILSMLINLGFTNYVLATESEEALVERAVQQTQQLLNSRKQRQGVIDKSRDAQAADQYTRDLLGTQQNVDAAYGIAADILPIVMRQAENDPQKLAELLETFKKDPEAFYKSLPAEQRDKIKALSRQVVPKSQP